MKLGEVLQTERERRRLSREEMASLIALQPADYTALEEGDPLFEIWAPRLGHCAMILGVPTSRLISATGRARGWAERGDQTGRLIRTHREQLGMCLDDLADGMGISLSEMVSIESGESPLERYGIVLLRFAEAVEQPIFNFFNPCGIPLAQLTGYP